MRAPKTWRGEREIRGLQAQLKGAINADTTGAVVELDITTAHKLIEVCEQARWTEQNHEYPGGRS